MQSALGRLARGRSTLTVAHRLATVAEADVLFVMERGRIVERGRPAELLRAGGLYARLSALQQHAVARRPDPGETAR